MAQSTGIKGARVRQLREDLGMSQADLARAIQRMLGAINQSTISNIETGNKGMRVDALIALSLALQTSSDYLLGLTDDPEPRTALIDQVVLVEHDPARRQYLQQLFDAIQALPVDLRADYWSALSTLYDGLISRRETEKRMGAITRRNPP